MPKRQKIISWLLRAAACLICLCCLAYACLYVFLQRDPDELVQTCLAHISARTGLQFTAAAVDVTLLPLPAFALSDIAIRGNGIELTAAWAQARPTLASIFHGDLFPGFISILRPRLSISVDADLENPDAIIQAIRKNLPARQSGAAPDLPASLQLELSQFDATVTGKNASLQLASLDASFLLRANGDISGFCRFGALRLYAASQFQAAIENFRIAGQTNIHNVLEDSRAVRANARVFWRGICRDVAVNLEFDAAGYGWKSRAAIAGELDLGGAAAPVSISGRVSRLASGKAIAFRNVAWSLGADSGALDVDLILPVNPADFTLRGVVRANRLSLTQWLGFARNLCPGLQLALDNIYAVSLEFSLNRTGLKASALKGSCCGATFSGTGGVASWKKPVVALNIVAPDVNLGLGLPEAVGITPLAPRFTHPPLTPMPGEPLKPGKTGVDYDIRLAARLLRYGPLRIRNAHLRIYPGKLDKTGLQDVLLDSYASLYGGSVNGSCILGADKSLPIYITGKAEKVNGASISRDMPLLPFRQGVWHGSATVTSRGKQLAPFLVNLRGNVSANGDKASLAATGAKTIFDQISTSAGLHSAQWDGKRLTFDARWQARVKDDSLNGQATVDGKISFGEDGMNFRQLPGSITISAPKLQQLGQVKISGKFSAQSGRDIFELEDGAIEALGLILRGDARLNGAKEQLQGQLHTDIANPQAVLARAGFKSAKIPKAFVPVKIRTDFSAANDVIKLGKLTASFGQINAAGSCSASFKSAKPYYNFDLKLDKINLADFIDKPGRQSDWNFPIFNTFNADGKLAIASLHGFNSSMGNVRGALKLADGRLAATDVAANFHGAPLHASFDGDFRNGLSFDSHIRVNAFNLAAAAQEQKIEARLTGSASMDMQLRARLAGTRKLTSALNGKWSFSVRNGSWQGVNKGKPGGITRFNVAEASGGIASGVVQSGNFRLEGPGLNVTGKGDLNLNNQTIDCDFYVSMKGLPDFPLRLYGPLKNTKTSIGAGKMILNAVGDVTGGFVNAVGGLLKGAWGIFSR